MKAKELKLMRKRLGAVDKVDDPLKLLDCDDKSLAQFVESNKTVGINVRLAYQSSADLGAPGNSTTTLLQQCLDLFEQNMGDLYLNSSWGLNMEEKREELQHKKARFLLVSDENGSSTDPAPSDTDLAAFVHFRFCYDDDDDPEYVVLYVYEIQVNERYRRLGLGSRLMAVLESIALQLDLAKVMLTVFHKNTAALEFYRNKLSYIIDQDSPSQHGEAAEYEILSKTPKPNEQ